ncbi:MAG: sugar ABC transporter ATP-binding protein [Spirochaetaceae bacterium]|nr:MAG: sugar ABC transporter ATP-binding protein [Spirochaetaceae bacterium]
MNQESILSLNNISKIYPGTIALHDITLDVWRGETHGIIGKNGAGKSTLVGIVAGLVTPTAGTFTINGRVHDDLSRIGARREHVSIVPQEPQLIEQYTVAENLFMPDYPTLRGGVRVDWPTLYRQATEVLRRAGLAIDARMLVGDVGIGMRQILMMLKASYVEQADIIVLDEAFASLSEREEQLFYRIIRERKAAGCTILHISHRIDELLEVCDRMTVLRDGRTVCTVRRDEVDRRSLAALIVGEAAAEVAETAGTAAPGEPATPAAWDERLPHGEELLGVNGLSRVEAFHDISFSVRRNEILGIAGMMGSGRTEILKAIIGMHPIDSGTIQVRGTGQPISDPRRAQELGIVYLPEERDAEGLIQAMSVKSNAVLSALKWITRAFMINRPAETALAADLTRRLEVKCSSVEQEVRELSGGNRQKVVVAKVVSTRPSVLLLDEPTKGIDISARRSLLQIIRNEISRDAAVVMTAPGVEELMAVCDRILVLYRGRLVGEFPGPSYREEELYHAMQGGTTETPHDSPIKEGALP